MLEFEPTTYGCECATHYTTACFVKHALVSVVATTTVAKNWV